MPWFTPVLDPDFAETLKSFNLRSGRVLDLGTGPGTQAIALAKIGFEVVASDISGTAVKKAEALAQQKSLTIRFVQDDILATKLEAPFDIVFDRGIFHIFPPAERPAYVRSVRCLLKEGGYLFLKCFSDQEPPGEGPYRLSEADLRGALEPAFKVRTVRATLFEGVRQPKPHAFFCVLQK